MTKAGFNIYSEFFNFRGSGYPAQRVTIGAWLSNNNYDTPHQGRKEIARRARQIAAGKLQVSV